jgi:hypothetical protein
MIDFRATPEEWARVEANIYSAVDVCVLELRDRVKALEANSKPTPNDRQIRSLLVDRVAIAIDRLPTKDWNKETWDDEARAAIREVAAWLREQGTPAIGWATRLQQEAER